MRYAVLIGVGGLAACGEPAPPTPITLTIGTIYLSHAGPEQYVPLDLTATELVVYTADGERFPTAGAYHGTADGRLVTDEVPAGAFTLAIGRDRYETRVDHDMVVTDTVVGSPEDVVTGETVPVALNLDLESWRDGYSLSIVDADRRTILRDIQKQLTVSPGDSPFVAAVLSGVVAWPGRAPAMTDTFSVECSGTTAHDDDSSETLVFATGDVQVDTMGRATASVSGYLDLTPFTHASLVVPSPDPLDGDRSWRFEVFDSPGNDHEIRAGDPRATLTGPIDGEPAVVSIPIIGRSPPLIVASYTRTRELAVGTQVVSVAEGMSAPIPVTHERWNTVRFTPLLGLPVFSFDYELPKTTAGRLDRPLVVALDSGAPATAADTELVLRVAQVDGSHGFVVRGMGSKLLVPTELIAAGQYIATLDVSANREHATSSMAVTFRGD